MRLRDENGYVQDTSDFNVWDTDASELEDRGQSYAKILGASQFVLCPRGIGSSSFCLFEKVWVVGLYKLVNVVHFIFKRR